MFSVPQVTDCFRGLVGFEQSYDQDLPVIDADLRSSASGLFLNHPLLTYDNILAITKDFGAVNVRPWSGTETYRAGAIVQVGGTYYRALTDSISQNPAAANSTYWAVTTLLSAFLRRQYQLSTVKMLHRLFSKKTAIEASKQLLASMVLYEGQGNMSARIPKMGRFVGLRLTLKNADTIALLTKIGLQVDTAQSGVEIYLFHSSSSEPVRVFTLNQTKSITFQWHSITQEVLSFLSDTVNAGGSYYIGYYENALTGQALAKDINFHGGGCGSCTESVVNKAAYQKWSPYMDVQPFYVNSPVVGELWDQDREMYIDSTNFGLNVQVGIQCDISRVVCQNRNVFAHVLHQQLVCDLLQEMAFSMRDNQLRQKVAQAAAVALDNQENGQWGEMKKLEKAIEAADFDFSDLSPVCNPCSAGRRGVRMGSAWG